MTDYSNVPTIYTGDWIDAAWLNQYVGDNFRALKQGLVNAGDMPYAVDSNTIGAVALVANGILIGGASAPEFLPFVANGVVIGGGSEPEFLAPGAPHTFLKWEGGEPIAGSLVYKRQGGHADNWSTHGTTNYALSNALIMVGSVSMTLSSGNGAASVAFGTPFSNVPVVFPAILNAFTKKATIHVSSVTTTGFSLRASDVDAESYSVSCFWLAIGDKS